MHVGAVTTTAQVTSEAPQLQSETTQVSTLINANTVSIFLWRHAIMSN